MKFVNTPNFERCNKSSFFVPESVALCNEITNKNLETNIKYYMLSFLVLSRKNQTNYLCSLILLSGDISLNPGPPVDMTTVNEDWNVFKKRGFHMAHVNINSLLPKIDELRAIAFSTKIAIIGITESKLDNTVTDSEVSIEGYNLLRCDRNRHGGGVACFIRNDICYNSHKRLSENVECVMFDVLFPKTKPFTVAVFYRPPDQNNFVNNISDEFTTLDFDEKEFYLLGDFNINTLCNGRSIFKMNKTALKSDHVSGLQKQYVEFCSLYGLKQLIVEPTPCATATVIDHFLTNCVGKVSQSGVLNVGLSDHQMIFCTRKVKKVKFNTHKHIKFRSFKNNTKEQYQGLLRDTNFPNYNEFTDIDLAYSDFLTKLMSVIDTIAPTKEARIKCNSQEWFDGEIADKIATRDKLFKKFKKSKLQINSDLWNEAKSNVQNLINKKKKEYYKNKITENTGKPKELWKTLKSMGLDNSKKSDPRDI